MRIGLLLVIAVALVFAGCQSTPPSPEYVRNQLEASLEVAQDLHKEGKDPEAHQVLCSIARIDDDLPGLRELEDEIPENVDDLFDKPWLGSNFTSRPACDRSIAARVLLYLPDRILDLFDIISFDVHFGLGLYLDVHVTQALQAGGGFRTVGGIGWHDHRSLGLSTRFDAGLNLLCFGTQYYNGSLIGTSGIRSTNGGVAGIHKPWNRIYQEQIDYWNYGFHATAVIAGVDFDYHLIEIYDFLVGWLTFDPLNDDFALTRGLDLTSWQKDLLDTLTEINEDSEAIELYEQRYLD